METYSLEQFSSEKDTFIGGQVTLIDKGFHCSQRGRITDLLFPGDNKITVIVSKVVFIDPEDAIMCREFKDNGIELMTLETKDLKISLGIDQTVTIHEPRMEEIKFLPKDHPNCVNWDKYKPLSEGVVQWIRNTQPATV